METKQLIECIKDKRRNLMSVAMRQALCYYLYQENIPCTIIANTLGKTKRYIYMAIYRTKDFLEVGDRTTQMSVEEIKQHKLRIIPITVDGEILSRHIGYKLVIDNIIV